MALARCPARRRGGPAVRLSSVGARGTGRCAVLGSLLILLAACGGGGGGGGSDPGGGVDIPPEPEEPARSLAGTITVAGSVRVDGDVNDPDAPYSSNDEREVAQALPNPTVLNGFASAAPTERESDRFGALADWRDVYAVELVADQQITLRVSDHQAEDPYRNDLDLYLYDAGMQLRAYADGIGEFETLQVPAGPAGLFYLVVEAAAGVSKYVLYVGNSAGARVPAGIASSADFRPNEVIVRFGDKAAASYGPADDTPALVSGLTDVRLAAAPGWRSALLSWRDGDVGRALLDSLGSGRQQWAGGGPARRGVPRPPDLAPSTATGRADPLVMDARYLTRKVIKALARRSDIAGVEPNFHVAAAVAPDDSLYGSQWHYPFINLPAAWDVATVAGGGRAVTVAVVDTGVLLRHPDLAGRVVAGYDFISDPAVAADGDGIDPNPDDAGDRRGPSNLSSFHGTHVAGTVAANTGNGSGIAGVSWGASIMPIRVLGVGGGSGYDLVQGIRYAAGLDNVSGQRPDRRADIINLSLGCTACYSQTLQDAISAARAAGVIVVAAAGNASSDAKFYPAAYEGVVAVGAVTSGSERASYSNFGDFVDVVAPGGDDADRDGNGYPDRILSTMGDDSSGAVEFRYGWSSGTSMAAPHVAGIAALMKSVYPQLTPAQFDVALASGAIVNDLGAGGRDPEYGYGLIDAFKAVRAAQALGGGPQGGFVSATPTLLDFPADTVARRFSLSQVGQGAPAIVEVRATESWLSVAADDGVGGDGFGGYLAVVDRGGLAAAVYRARIEVWQADGSVLAIPVNLEVAPAVTGAGDAGRLYVLLIDAATRDVVQQAEADRAPGGGYAYSFAKVAGDRRYRLYAGSDVDNDLLICTVGETCGAYPTLDDAHVLTVGGALRGLDFEVGIQDQFGLGTAQLATDAGDLPRLR